MFALKELLQLYTDLSRNFTLDFAEKSCALKLLLLFPGSQSPKVQLLKSMTSLCLKATSSVAACIYIKRPLLKPFFNWNAFIIQCLVHANHITKYHPYYKGKK